MRSAIATFKLLGFVVVCLMVVPTQLLILLLTKGPLAFVVPRWWHATLCRVFGIRIQIIGVPVTHKQVIYMCNHLSYLDILILGGLLRRSSFVAKKEVAGWPVFGFLANLQQTAYIERRASVIQGERDKIKQRVKRLQNLIIFPEGTSTDGLEVRDFKTSLFSLADGQETPDLLVQPVTLLVKKVDGTVPQTLAQLRHYTWPVEDETPLPAHLWRFMQSRGADVTLVFHDPLRAGDFDDRKTLAKACENLVSQGLDTHRLPIRIHKE